MLKETLSSKSKGRAWGLIRSPEGLNLNSPGCNPGKRMKEGHQLRQELNRKPSMSTFTQIVYPLVFTREGVSAGLVVVGPLSTLEGSNRRAPICVRFDPSRVSTVCCALTPDFIRGYSNLCPPGTAP